jgi:hypothetical protein
MFSFRNAANLGPLTGIVAQKISTMMQNLVIPSWNTGLKPPFISCGLPV